MPIVVATLIMLVVCCMQFWVGMGEEFGWMGYLFPRLEKLCGTTVALILMGIIRSGWHMVMIVQNENFLAGFLSLSVSNILMGSVLVWATKASKSVLPASLIHVMTNALPGVIAGVICYIVLQNYFKNCNVGKL